jgi:hypothetical protein
MHRPWKGKAKLRPEKNRENLEDSIRDVECKPRSVLRGGKIGIRNKVLESLKRLIKLKRLKKLKRKGKIKEILEVNRLGETLKYSIS